MVQDLKQKRIGHGMTESGINCGEIYRFHTGNGAHLFPVIVELPEAGMPVQQFRKAKAKVIARNKNNSVIAGIFYAVGVNGKGVSINIRTAEEYVLVTFRSV